MSYFIIFLQKSQGGNKDLKKLYIAMFSVILLAMATVPIIAVKKEPIKAVNSTVKATITQNTEKSEIFANKDKEESFLVYITDKKQIEKVGLSEYLLGVLSCEMDESYPPEALKAQAVAAHTLLLYRKAKNNGKKYDITDSYLTDQGYYTPEKRLEKYGDELEKLENKIESAVNQVKNEVIYYNNKPIMAVYHDTSGGKTENASDIWGGNYPYLKSVDSISDMLNPNYLSKVVVSKNEFEKKLKKIVGSLPKKKAFIGKTTTTSAGTVKKIVIGSKSLSGQIIRETFNLKSANFDLKYEDNKFTFTVRGFGHGVGMSQYGAYYMANKGSNYKRILNWYYKGCTIK